MHQAVLRPKSQQGVSRDRIVLAIGHRFVHVVFWFLGHAPKKRGMNHERIP